MSELNEQLLPCAFCGSPADLKRIGNDHTKTRAVQVKCSNRECRVERTDKALTHGLDWLEAVAIKNWNRRPPSPAEGGQKPADERLARAVYEDVIATVRAFGEKACADYIEQWHPVGDVVRKLSSPPLINESDERQMRAAAPQAHAEPVAAADADAIRERLRDAIAVALGDAMDCTRVWRAWQVGTMTQDDFSVIANDDERLEEIVDAALSVIPAPAAPGAERDTARLDWLDKQNQRKNASYRTTYGWKYEENHNRIALTDHHFPVCTVREAIDAAMSRDAGSGGGNG